MPTSKNKEKQEVKNMPIVNTYGKGYKPKKKRGLGWKIVWNNKIKRYVKIKDR